jgi:beta-lactamase regulating signal transducer with metallopeptidase domain
MIASFMIYALAISALISMGSVIIERGMAAQAWPRRGVWLMAMLASLVLPGLAMVSTSQGTALSAATTTPSAVASPAFNPQSPDVASAPSQNSLPARLRSALYFEWPAFPRLNAALIYLWIASSCCLLSFCVIGWVRLRRLLRDSPIEKCLDETVRVSNYVGPAVIGFVRPQVIVPRWLLAEEPVTCEMIILHEREHIAARDPLCLLLALSALVVAPWNLPLWWQLRRLRFAIEVDCDTRVLRRDVDISKYGETLLSIGQRGSLTPAGAIALTETASRLEQRILIMTTETYRYSKLVLFAAIALSTSCLALAAELSAPAATKTELAEANTSAHSGFADERITVRLQDADVRDILSLLAHGGGRSVYINSRVGGKITIQFSDTKSSEALDTVLRMQGLVKRQEGNSIYIDPAPTASGTTAQPTYTGQRINLHFQDVEIRTILRIIAETQNQNIVVNKNVQGKTSIDLKDTPWDEALDIILSANGLVRRQEGNIIIIELAPTTVAGQRASLLETRRSAAG